MSSGIVVAVVGTVSSMVVVPMDESIGAVAAHRSDWEVVCDCVSHETIISFFETIV